MRVLERENQTGGEGGEQTVTITSSKIAVQNGKTKCGILHILI